MLKLAVFPGTFSPIHKGHINIIKKASKLFDKVYIAVSVNIDKQKINLNDTYLKAKSQIQKLKLKNVVVAINRDLVVNFAKQRKCNYIIRSIRNNNDFKYEMNIAKNNYYLCPMIHTVFIVPDENLLDISSSNIREAKRQQQQFTKNKYA